MVERKRTKRDKHEAAHSPHDCLITQNELAHDVMISHHVNPRGARARCGYAGLKNRWEKKTERQKVQAQDEKGRTHFSQKNCREYDYRHDK
jgi:hypothetical protein